MGSSPRSYGGIVPNVKTPTPQNTQLDRPNFSHRMHESGCSFESVCSEIIVNELQKASFLIDLFGKFPKNLPPCHPVQSPN
jgi:hypothetical protein